MHGLRSLGNPFSAELMAHQGFDAVTIDLQHGPVDFQAAVGMLAAISTTPAVPMVRVPWNGRFSRRNSWTWRLHRHLPDNQLEGGNERWSVPAAIRRAARRASGLTARFSMAAPTIGSTLRMAKFSSSP